MQDKLKFGGKIESISEINVISQSFKKRDVVLTSSGEYPQSIIFQLSQDRTDLINGCKVGDLISVHFNIRGKGWTNPQGEVKHFVTLDIWKIDKGESAPVQAPTPAKTESEDIPF